MTHLTEPQEPVWFIDFDATVAETEGPAMVVAINRLLTAFGGDRLIDALGHGGTIRTDFVRRYVQEWAGIPFPHMIPLCEKAVGTNLSDIERRQLIDDCFDETAIVLKSTRPVNGILKVLDTLSRADVMLVVVTSSPLERVVPPLEFVGAASYFVPREGGLQPPTDSTTRVRETGALTEIQPSYPLSYLVWSAESLRLPHKNARQPDIYLRAAADIARHRGTSVEAVMANSFAIEDSPSGVEGAIAAGVAHVIGWSAAEHIVDKDAHAERLTLRGANHVVDDAQKLLAHLRVLGYAVFEPSVGVTTSNESGISPALTSSVTGSHTTLGLQ